MPLDANVFVVSGFSGRSVVGIVYLSSLALYRCRCPPHVAPPHDAVPKLDVHRRRTPRLPVWRFSRPVGIVTSPLGRVPSIVMSTSVCLSVCLSARVTTKTTHSRSRCMLARSSSDSVAICYVLPVFRMTSYFRTTVLWRIMGIPKRRRNTTSITAEILTRFRSVIKTRSTHCKFRIGRGQSLSSMNALLGPFHGAIAVPSVTRCRCCRRHRCAGGVQQWRRATERHLVNGSVKQAAARSGEWAQHFSNASFLRVENLRPLPRENLVCRSWSPHALMT